MICDNCGAEIIVKKGLGYCGCKGKPLVVGPADGRADNQYRRTSTNAPGAPSSAAEADRSAECYVCGNSDCEHLVKNMAPVAAEVVTCGFPPPANDPKIGGYVLLSRSTVEAIEYAAERIAADNPLGNGKTALFWSLVVAAAQHIAQGHAKGRKPEAEAPR